MIEIATSNPETEAVKNYIETLNTSQILLEATGFFEPRFPLKDFKDLMIEEMLERKEQNEQFLNENLAKPIIGAFKGNNCTIVTKEMITNELMHRESLIKSLEHSMVEPSLIHKAKQNVAEERKRFEKAKKNILKKESGTIYVPEGGGLVLYCRSKNPERALEKIVKRIILFDNKLANAKGYSDETSRRNYIRSEVPINDVAGLRMVLKDRDVIYDDVKKIMAVIKRWEGLYQISGFPDPENPDKERPFKIDKKSGFPIYRMVLEPQLAEYSPRDRISFQAMNAESSYKSSFGEKGHPIFEIRNKYKVYEGENEYELKGKDIKRYDEMVDRAMRFFGGFDFWA